ncbi:lytic transglycosylase domain-containing protein [Treponema pallidum]|nr:lytic transglycosylase domain-containing protein [Treponema pallidum]QUL34981.2 lytic transglycosylase domain-containing protein [Treponema pallidum]QUL43863.2 lytic transglycosylase domain-containing protein [Treponema pallidum]
MCARGAREVDIPQFLRDKNYTPFLKPTDEFLEQVAAREGASYFIGLHLKRAKFSEEAHEYFVRGAAQAAPYRQLCAHEAHNTGSPLQRLAFIEKQLHVLNAGSDARTKTQQQTLRLLRSRVLFELERYYSLRTVVESWYNDRALAPHTSAQFAALIAALPDLPRIFKEVHGARVDVFHRNYKRGWERVRLLLRSSAWHTRYATNSVLSDFGKAALYGSENSVKAAQVFLDHLAHLSRSTLSNAELEARLRFYCYFYAARLYSRSASHKKQALPLFKKAEKVATRRQDADNALWYYLDVLRALDFDSFFKVLVESAPRWRSDSWFSDLVDYAIVQLTTQQDWGRLATLQEVLTHRALPERSARVTYVLARSGTLSEESARRAYRTIFETAHSSLYYRVLAACALGIPLEEALYKVRSKRTPHPFLTPDESRAILQGYVDYHLDDMFYQAMVQFYPDIPLHLAEHFANAHIQRSRWSDAVRIQSYAIRFHGARYSVEHLKIAYPRPWLDVIQGYAGKYHIEEYLLFALIRSESLFQPQVISRAGAVGLAQLMRPTASDIARKLNIDTYDLTDPDINVRFGSLFFSDLIRRFDGSVFCALFSYNAGPSRVRKWKKQRGSLPDDLFLETLPLAEPREYGRKILSAAVMYGYLYYQKQASDVVCALLPEFCRAS